MLDPAPGFCHAKLWRISTVAAHLNNASMEYVDCDSDGSMSVQDLEARLSRFEGKSLVVVTHLFGLMSNSPEIRNL